MIEIYEVNVDYFNINQVAIEWRIKPTTEDVNLYTFRLYRSLSPEGKFNKVKDLKNQFFYYDGDLSLRSKWRRYYYKLEVIEDATPTNISESPVGTLAYEPDPIAREIIRRNNILLKNFNGIPSKIYINKTVGQKCPKCFDFLKNRKKFSKCPVCMGTGFLGGFLGPIDDILINYNPSQKMIQRVSFEVQPDNIAAWMSNYPILNPKDLVIENGVKFWRVVRVSRTEKLRTPVHQMLELKRINHSDIEYQLPNLGLTENKKHPHALTRQMPH